VEIEVYAQKFKIPHWRGVFMRDSLPSKANNYETGIVNLDSKYNRGTHWVAYAIKGDTVNYFDSFGVEPPSELLKYFGLSRCVFYNSEQIQKLDEINCGHLCLTFLLDNGFTA
jgi:hypothetical protein